MPIDVYLEDGPGLPADFLEVVNRVVSALPGDVACDLAPHFYRDDDGEPNRYGGVELTFHQGDKGVCLAIPDKAARRLDKPLGTRLVGLVESAFSRAI